MRYPAERREALLAKLEAPYNRSVNDLATEEGISAATLYNWRKQARRKGRLLPNPSSTPDGWSSEEKFNAVLETAALTEEELAEYCRRRGLYPAQISRWRASCEQANARSVEAADRQAQVTKMDRRRIKELERELRRKDAALAETTALLVLRKKVQAIWGDEEK
jgi:transposase-like protein